MTPPFVLLMPGQGAQAIGMGRAFYDRFDESRDIYKQANRCFGFDVTAICFDGLPEALTDTRTCQPALFTTSLAAYAAFRKVTPSGLTPLAAAGLSLGELTSLAAAEAFSLEEGFYLVKTRGEAMAECAARNKGAMLALVGLPPEAVEEICKKSGAWGANYNSPDQVVLSGTADAIAKAEDVAKGMNAKRAMRLEVAGAFHCPLMQPAADALKAALAKVRVRAPRFPVISNVTAQLVTEAAPIPELLVRQIVSPVRWDASMRTAIAAGATCFLEFPPARVLTGLLRRIDKSATGVAIDTPEDLAKAGEALQLTLSV